MNYYQDSDLSKFGNIAEWDKTLADKFFPYCIDAYTADNIKRGVDEESMMESIHVGAAIRSGATLVHGVMMMNKAKKMLI
jgi:hypothetical protein